jgi:hypothetical protein
MLKKLSFSTKTALSKPISLNKASPNPQEAEALRTNKTYIKNYLLSKETATQPGTSLFVSKEQNLH